MNPFGHVDIHLNICIFEYGIKIKTSVIVAFLHVELIQKIARLN